MEKPNVLVKTIMGCDPFNYTKKDRYTKEIKALRCIPLEKIEIYEKDLWELLESAREGMQDNLGGYNEELDAEYSIDLEMPSNLTAIINYFNEKEVWNDLAEMESMDEVDDYLEGILADNIVKFCKETDHYDSWVEQFQQKMADATSHSKCEYCGHEDCACCEIARGW